MGAVERVVVTSAGSAWQLEQLVSPETGSTVSTVATTCPPLRASTRTSGKGFWRP